MPPRSLGASWARRPVTRQTSRLDALAARRTSDLRTTTAARVPPPTASQTSRSAARVPPSTASQTSRSAARVPPPTANQTSRSAATVPPPTGSQTSHSGDPVAEVRGVSHGPLPRPTTTASQTYGVLFQLPVLEICRILLSRARTVHAQFLHDLSVVRERPLNFPPRESFRRRTKRGIVQSLRSIEQHIRNLEFVQRLEPAVSERPAIRNGIYVEATIIRAFERESSKRHRLLLRYIGMPDVQSDEMGAVCTGLDPDLVDQLLRRRRFSSRLMGASSSCTVCREDYADGDELGSLDCTHTYHVVCIKPWLVRNNRCPLCRAIALSE